ncbi:MAG: tetratricopeptide repeat protein, partial [Cyanobacteria bacterium P01_F01_bin.143]
EKRNQDDACIEKEKGDQEIQGELTNYKIALKDINIALKENPNLANAYVSRGFLYYQQGDYKSALENFNRGIELDKNLEEAYLYRGRIYFKRGEQYYQEAIDNYNQALTINPKSVAAYLYRGEIYSKLGMKTEAIEEYQEGLRLDFDVVIGGNMPLHDDGLIYLVRGNIRKKKSGDFGHKIGSLLETDVVKMIIEDYECALKFDPNLVEVYIELGDFYDQIADFSANKEVKDTNYLKALENYNKALVLFGKELYVHGVGITIQFDAKTEAFTIINVLKNSPAWNAGIEIFDEILEVDGLSTDNLNIDDVINMIRGQVGTQVTLRIRSYGIDETEKTLTRTEFINYLIAEQAVEAYKDRGFLHKELGNKQKAIEDFKEAEILWLILLDAGEEFKVKYRLGLSTVRNQINELQN